jgi:hypothetical protein
MGKELLLGFASTDREVGSSCLFPVTLLAAGLALRGEQLSNVP